MADDDDDDGDSTNGVTSSDENTQEVFDRKVKELVQRRRIERAADELEQKLELEVQLQTIPKPARRMARSVIKELTGNASIDNLYDRGLTRDAILSSEGVPCLVEDTIPLGRYTVMFGMPGLLKTHICNTLCSAVANGGTWFDFYQAKPGVTAYWSGEGVEQFKPQFGAYDSMFGQNGSVPSLWWDVPLDLSRHGHVVAIVGALETLRVRAGQKHGICIFDPDGMFRGGELGSVENFEAMAFSLKAMAKVMRHWAFVVVGHTEAKGERHRGTEHLRMYAGAHVHVRRIPAGDQVVAVWEKFDRGSHPAIWIAIEESGPGIVVKNARETKFIEADFVRESRKRSKSKDKDESLDAGAEPALSEASQKRWDKAEQLIKDKPGISKSQLAEDLGGSKRDAYALFKELEDAGLIEVEKVGKSHCMTWIGS